MEYPLSVFLQIVRGMVGPPLDHLANHIYLAGQLPNNPANLAHWIERPHDIHPDTVMPNRTCQTRMPTTSLRTSTRCASRQAPRISAIDSRVEVARHFSREGSKVRRSLTGSLVSQRKVLLPSISCRSLDWSAPLASEVQ
jgi:hypothetical protein